MSDPVDHLTTAPSPAALGKVTVVCGPTAVGKGTVVSRLRALHPEVYVSVSVTTRAPRPGELNGVHYHFVSDAEFDDLIAHRGLLEWALVHGAARYGTPRQQVEDARADGRHSVLELDLQGARQVRLAMPDAQQIFLLPPSWDELVRRLTDRGTESREQQQRRLATAKLELAAIDEFDALVVNTTIDDTVAQVVRLMGL